jgi:uncharacterized membrane protein YqhA
VSEDRPAARDENAEFPSPSAAEVAIERALSVSRFIVFFPVFALPLGALALMLAGTGEFVAAVHGCIVALIDTNSTVYKDAVAPLMTALDLFLTALVLLVMALGLYETFISKVDPEEGQSRRRSRLQSALPMGLRVHGVDQIKTKVVKVIALIITVKIFNAVLEHAVAKGGKAADMLDILMLAGVLILIAGAFFLLHQCDPHKGHDGE